MSKLHYHIHAMPLDGRYSFHQVETEPDRYLQISIYSLLCGMIQAQFLVRTILKIAAIGWACSLIIVLIQGAVVDEIGAITNLNIGFYGFLISVICTIISGIYLQWSARSASTMLVVVCFLIGRLMIYVLRAIVDAKIN